VEEVWELDVRRDAIDLTATRIKLAHVNSTQFLLVLPLLSVTAGALIAQGDWDEPFPPHRIADNLYYVGSKGLATYLITTTNGHILINSLLNRGRIPAQLDRPVVPIETGR
jgi:hypothetical protein